MRSGERMSGSVWIDGAPIKKNGGRNLPPVLREMA